MPAVESTFTDDQKANLDQARKILGLRSREALLLTFADYAVELANIEIQNAGGRLAYLRSTGKVFCRVKIQKE